MDTIIAGPRMRSGSRRFILIGAGVGLAWGIAMRAWMRFITAQPEFSWSGTIFILGAATITGTVLGLAWHRRAVGGVGWWRLSVLTLLLLGAGGAIMWPAVIFGAMALGRPWKTWIRVTLGVLAAASQIPVIIGIADNWKFGAVQIGIATVVYIPLLFLEVWAFSVAFRPTRNPVPTPARLRLVLIALAVVAAGFAVLATGVGGGM